MPKQRYERLKEQVESTPIYYLFIAAVMHFPQIVSIYAANVSAAASSCVDGVEYSLVWMMGGGDDKTMIKGDKRVNHTEPQATATITQEGQTLRVKFHKDRVFHYNHENVPVGTPGTDMGERTFSLTMALDEIAVQILRSLYDMSVGIMELTVMDSPDFDGVQGQLVCLLGVYFVTLCCEQLHGAEFTMTLVCGFRRLNNLFTEAILHPEVRLGISTSAISVPFFNRSRDEIASMPFNPAMIKAHRIEEAMMDDKEPKSLLVDQKVIVNDVRGVVKSYSESTGLYEIEFQNETKAVPWEDIEIITEDSGYDPVTTRQIVAPKVCLIVTSDGKPTIVYFVNDFGCCGLMHLWMGVQGHMIDLLLDFCRVSREAVLFAMTRVMKNQHNVYYMLLKQWYYEDDTIVSKPLKPAFCDPMTYLPPAARKSYENYISQNRAAKKQKPIKCDAPSDNEALKFAIGRLAHEKPTERFEKFFNWGQGNNRCVEVPKEALAFDDGDKFEKKIDELMEAAETEESEIEDIESDDSGGSKDLHYGASDQRNADDYAAGKEAHEEARRAKARKT